MTRILALSLAILLPLPPALADSHAEPHAAVELLQGWRMADGTHMTALRVSLDDGWKTYWRAPGEAGIPPQMDWAGSENLAGVEIHWPAPEVFVSNGMTTLGFHHELILPLSVRPGDPQGDVAMSGTLAFGICQDICMPMQAEVSAVLPAAAQAEDRRIARALQRRPDTADEAGVVSATCEVAPIADGMRVTADLTLPAVGPGELVVMESADPSVWVSEAMAARQGDVLSAEADFVPATAQPFELDPSTLRFTVIARGRAVDIRGCTAP